MAGIEKNGLKTCCLFLLLLLIAVSPLAIGVPAALPDDARIQTGADTGAGIDTGGETGEGVSTRPLTVIVDNIETTSEVPVIHKGGRIYVPVRVLSESLGYPVQYVGEQKTVYIGVRPAGADLVDELTTIVGRKIKEPVSIGGIGYVKGYILAPGAFFEPRWHLDGRYQTITFSFGIPDNQAEDATEFTVKVDNDKTVARVKISKDEGLKEFNFNVKGANVLTVSCTGGKGGALVSPRAQ